MYIDTFWLVIIGIWIAYLLWRIYKLSSTLKQFGEFFDKYIDYDTRLHATLLNILIYEDATLLRKLSAKSREKIIKRQADNLRKAFKHCTFDKYMFNGKWEELETPMQLLSHAIGSPIPDFDDAKKENEDIEIALTSRIETTKL